MLSSIVFSGPLSRSLLLLRGEPPQSLRRRR
jgi:hypothetical protein